MKFKSKRDQGKENREAMEEVGKEERVEWYGTRQKRGDVEYREKGSGLNRKVENETETGESYGKVKRRRERWRISEMVEK